jgi:methylated-DNA-[protein]-cysteine S-methyltransferase
MSTAQLPPLSAQALLGSPLGAVRLAATDTGLAGLWFEGQKHHPGPLAAPQAPEHPVLLRAAQALAAYFAGQPTALHRLPLALAGTPFQQAVWRALCNIHPGRTVSYGALALALGRPEAVRAVAAAVGRNPVSLAVPCHRVLGAGGALTGYAGGLHRKQALLQLEAAWPA